MVIQDWFTHDLSKLKGLLADKEKKILIITHRNPDGDAIGSSLGLFNYLKNNNNQVEVLVPNPFPAFLSWMPGANHITIFSRQKEKAIKLLKSADILFTLDFNELARVVEFEENLKESKSYKILIDHHPYPQNFADLTISHTHVSSTSELIYKLLMQLKNSEIIDQNVASCIYAGILTDTGCFSFNSSRPETFHIVADLLERNIDKDGIYAAIFDNFSMERMRLMGYCLDKKMVFLPEYKAAYCSLSQEEMRQYNFKIGDSEGFVNLPLSIEGIIFSALFMENKDVVKVSMRSKGNFAVNGICSKYFKGGGHRNASGGESSETLEKTIEQFLKILPELKDELLRN